MKQDNSTVPSYYIMDDLYDSIQDDILEYSTLSDDQVDEYYDEFESTQDLTKLIKEQR